MIELLELAMGLAGSQVHEPVLVAEIQPPPAWR